MVMSEQSAAGAASMASCPGGMARQFRVQVWNPETPSHWKLVESFTELGDACSCAERLQDAGQQIRVVACNLPTAA